MKRLEIAIGQGARRNGVRDEFIQCLLDLTGSQQMLRMPKLFVSARRKHSGEAQMEFTRACWLELLMKQRHPGSIGKHHTITEGSYHVCMHQLFDVGEHRARLIAV
jgi:hypothetical protein